MERVCKVMPHTVRNCAWQITRRLARPGRAEQKEGVASTQWTSVRVHQDESFHGATEGWRVEHETVEGRSHGVKWTLERYVSENSQVPTHLETPRESTLGWKAVD